ncbi:ABC transporter permease subunit [Paenibacillus sp. J5C_2022]|uniref:ABC transporter permease n=1 Tax=Paenibacillus sp. J5C2022 TaxID=2977129 RepID=UPI0021CF0B98|nr:ABC transporter permease subunit [Paenibacillus sp. J5C2022]MCU6709027.1 ABC transporter permease subunit [Paenibacillus sp. J5C2022]
MKKLALGRLWQHRVLLLMLLPGLAWFFVYRYMPMYGAVIAFKDYQFLNGIVGSPWANPWYKHFQYFYESPYFSQLLNNTLLISMYKLLFGTAPPILLAILINECKVRWFSRLVQTLSYMPHFLSWVIIYGIALAFLSQSTGLVNRWLESMGLDAIPFLQSTEWFRSILVGTDVWQNLGWGAIIYLAAIAGVDPTLYESARVDGASRLRMIWHITLPGIRSVIVMLFIIKLGQVMDAGFDQIYIFYNVLVYPVADIIDTWVFRTGLEQMNFSVASAVGLFKSAIGLVLVLAANKMAKKWGEGIW